MTDKERIEEISTELCVGDILARVLFELEEKGIEYKFEKKGEEYVKLIAGWVYTYSIEANEKMLTVENTVADYEDSYEFVPDEGESIWITNNDTKSEVAKCVEQIIAVLIEDN